METKIADMVEAICSDCRTTRQTKITGTGQPRTPMGWHKHEGQAYCRYCWAKRYLLRAISIPVAEPLDCSWEDLRKDIKTMCRESTRASNWIMTELYARDIRRKDEEQMPPMPRVYLYPELRREFPTLPPKTLASLEQTIQKKYRAARYKIIWTRSITLPAFRYPTPFTAHNQSWSVRIEADKLILRIRIGEGVRDLRLKRGPQFRRQYHAMRLIAHGEAIPGEAAICDRAGTLMVKLIAWLPRKEAIGHTNSILRVHTGNDSLLVAVNTKDETLWTYNGDHLRRWSAEHRRRLKRWSEDQKYEQRPVPVFAERRQAAAIKYRNRLNSATHEIAAQLAGYALRRRFAAVEYDDAKRGFCEEFPWYRLRMLVSEKLAAHGVDFIATGNKEVEES